MGSGQTQSLEQITRRYDRLAPFYRVMEPLYLIHDGARRKAVSALSLSPVARIDPAGYELMIA